MKNLYITIIHILWFTTFHLSAQSLNKSYEANSEDTILVAPAFEKVTLKSSQITLENFNIFSPDESIQLSIYISSDNITYALDRNSNELISQSVLNYSISEGHLTDGIAINSINQSSNDQTIDLLYGETTSIRNNYNELILHCSNKYDITFDVIFRAYNEGIAFRIHFTDNNSTAINVTNDQVQFTLSDEYTAYAESGNELGYTPKSTTTTFSSLIPLTLVGDNNCLCINEAGNDNYTRAIISGLGNNILQTTLIAKNSIKTAPFYLPWRLIVIGDNISTLYNNKDFIYGLTYTNEYDQNQWDWVKPGTVFRCLDLSTQGGKNAIDFCIKYNIKYMMFDAGWYGLGYGQSNEKNPSSNPLDVIDGLDMEQVTSYASSKGIGVILYINKVGWDYYNNEDMLDLYKSWGIKGIKLGFMDGYSSSGNEKIYKLIKMAGERKMIVNVHDNFRPTGMIFKYPNLLTAEGIRGNEYIQNTGDHTTLLPFTRFLTGAGDYTIRYLGNDPDYTIPPYLKTSRAHQLAISVMFYSPLQHIFWGAKPGIYNIPVETESFTDLPTTWEEYNVVSAKMGEYSAIARNKNDSWFLGVTTNSSARKVSLPLDFLEDDTDYLITLYTDKESETIEKSISTLENLKKSGVIINNTLNLNLWTNGGALVIFDKDGTLDSADTMESKELLMFPNPTKDGIITVQLSTVSSNINVKVYSMQGQFLKLYQYNHLDKFTFDINNLTNGLYLISVETDRFTYTNKLLLDK